MPEGRRGSSVVILMILFSVGYIRPGNSASEVVLRGSLDCVSGKVQFATGMAGRKDFDNLGKAAAALNTQGYPESAVASLKSILKAACDNLSKRLSGRGSTETRDLASGTRDLASEPSAPRHGTHVLTESSLVTLREQGTSIDFSISRIDIEYTGQAVLQQFEKHEGKTGCWQVTDKPPCFKCPDGTGFCIIESFKK